MKTKICYSIALIICAACLFIFPSCRKTPINGKLDAQWQIMKIEYLEDAEEWAPAQRRYIDINLHVVNLRSVSENESSGAVIAGNLNYDKGTSIVTMDFPYNTGNSASALQSWGIYSNPVVFHIIKLDGKELIMKSSETIVTCRRY